MAGMQIRKGTSWKVVRVASRTRVAGESIAGRMQKTQAEIWKGKRNFGAEFIQHHRFEWYTSAFDYKQLGVNKFFFKIIIISFLPIIGLKGDLVVVQPTLLHLVVVVPRRAPKNKKHRPSRLQNLRKNFLADWGTLSTVRIPIKIFVTYSNSIFSTSLLYLEDYRFLKFASRVIFLHPSFVSRCAYIHSNVKIRSHTKCWNMYLVNTCWSDHTIWMILIL